MHINMNGIYVGMRVHLRLGLNGVVRAIERDAVSSQHALTFSMNQKPLSYGEDGKCVDVAYGMFDIVGVSIPDSKIVPEKPVTLRRTDRRITRPPMPVAPQTHDEGCRARFGNLSNFTTMYPRQGHQPFPDDTVRPGSPPKKP